MPKKLTVWVEEADLDDFWTSLRNVNVTVDDGENWESNKDMEQYTATTFIAKARHYLSLSPPDLVQSAEKIWFAAVYAVKELFLSCGGIDLKSHNSLKYFFRFACCTQRVPPEVAFDLNDFWSRAERMHRDVYGSGNFRASEYAQIISNVETFVNEFAKFDRKKIWAEFNTRFIAGSDPNVIVKKEYHTINLGGVHFKCGYSVLVPFFD